MTSARTGGPPKPERKPTIGAILLSFLGVGTAYLYLGHPLRAAVMVLAYAAVVLIVVVGPPALFEAPAAVMLLAVGIIVCSLLFLADAIRLSRRGRPGPRASYQRWTVYVGCAAATVVAFFLLGVLQDAHLVTLRTFSIPSHAMAPTLEMGDRVAAVMSAWREPAIARGDVVVYLRRGDEGDTYFVHRVVGLPGETVQMVGGRLQVDGVAVAREEAGRYPVDVIGHMGEAPLYREVLPGGTSHLLIEVEQDDGTLDDTPPLTVPADAYFVLGDNRDFSMDSRLAGPVPAADIVGHASTIYWSAAWDRLGRRVE